MVRKVNVAATGLIPPGRCGRRAILWLAFALSSSLSAVAQNVTQTGQITGSIKDPAGMMVARRERRA